MKIQGRILEISQATNPNGRRPIKFVLHEIYPDTSRWNRNGITYLEQYTRDNAESVKGMPLCAEFIDEDKDIPYGHGFTGYIDDMPVFENSIQVGVFENWSIEDIEINGSICRCLCGMGYINEGRYPKFVKWIEDQIESGITLCGSVEFVGTKENNGEIIYDGGWKEEGRIPAVYDYSGYCILTVKPSDPAAILIELNQLKDNNLEVIEMNEEMKKAFSDMKADIISEFKNTRNVEVNEQIGTLESQVAELNAKIEELCSQIESKDAEIAELNQKCKEAEENACKKVEESECKAKEAEENACKKEAELNELKKANKITELNHALSAFTDEEKDYAKDEIEAFNADPFSVEINSITTKIEATSYRKMREDQKNQTLEQNSMKDEFDGIMSAVDPIVKDDNTVEDFDCFA